MKMETNTNTKNDTSLSSILWPNPAPRGPITVMSHTESQMVNSEGTVIGTSSLTVYSFGTVTINVSNHEPLIDILNRVFALGLWQGRTENDPYPPLLSR